MAHPIPHDSKTQSNAKEHINSRLGFPSASTVLPHYYLSLSLYPSWHPSVALSLPSLLYPPQKGYGLGGNSCQNPTASPIKWKVLNTDSIPPPPPPPPRKLHPHHMPFQPRLEPDTLKKTRKHPLVKQIQYPNPAQPMAQPSLNTDLFQ